MNWASESIKDEEAATLVDALLHWRFSGLDTGEEGRFLLDKPSSCGG